MKTFLIPKSFLFQIIFLFRMMNLKCHFKKNPPDFENLEGLAI